MLRRVCGVLKAEYGIDILISEAKVENKVDQSEQKKQSA
jgi:hypothetical protein